MQCIHKNINLRQYLKLTKKFPHMPLIKDISEPACAGGSPPMYLTFPVPPKQRGPTIDT